MNIVLLTNILNPYRKAFYDELFRQCTEKGHIFHVLVMSAEEYNREWHYEDYQGPYSILLQCKAFRIGHLPIYINQDLYRQMSKLKPDIVIMAGGYMLPSVWKASSYKKKLGYQTFFWSESHLDEKREYRRMTLFLREKIRKQFYRKFDGFWYPGEKALQFIQKYSNEDAEYFQIPNLIDNTKFLKKTEAITQNPDWKQGSAKLKEKYNISQDKKILFAPMRLHWSKGLIPFMKLLHQTTGAEKVQLVVAGSGEAEAEKEIQNAAAELGIDLKLLGYQEEPQIIELYYAADAFFLPSVSDPSPLTCVEALWCGKPMLVSEYVGNYPEVIRQGENGYMFRYSNEAEALGIIAKFILQTEEWYKKASVISRQIAQEHFALDKVTADLLQNMKLTKEAEK